VENGYLMVELFFVLSGFVIFTAYSNALNSGKELLRFQFLRLGRLYPVHLVFLLLYLAVETARYVAIHQLQVDNLHVIPFEKNDLNAFIQQLLLLQAVGPTGNSLTFNAPAWSISVEFYTYLVFGVFVLTLKTYKEYIFFALALIAVALLAMDLAYGFTDLLRCFAGFFIGCLTAVLVKKDILKIPNYAAPLLLACILIFLELKTSKAFDVAIYFLSAALTAALVMNKDSVLNTVLKIKVFLWLGRISYSIYMSHSFALLVIGVLLRRVLKRPEIQNAEGLWIASMTVPETLVAMAVFLGFVGLLSQLTYSWIENPMREKSRRFADTKLR
jgi:peptidoglycan/LPS O-acetylase OafA/YrhL